MNHREEEAQARVSALLHNSGGTYAAASRETGVHHGQLSGWHRGLHVPQARSMEKLREVTS
jgi:transposase-like protein